jgi:Polyketide cyclase / dehydrase and lipid transport
MPTIELERNLVKSAPELWDDLASESKLSGWLGEVRVRAADPPHRLEWDVRGASGVIELESAGWGTRVRVQADVDRLPAWERLQARYALERSLRELLDHLSSGSLQSGLNSVARRVDLAPQAFSAASRGSGRDAGARRRRTGESGRS